MFGALSFSVFIITYTLAMVTGVADSAGSPRKYYLSTNQLDTEKAAEECYKMDMTLATERNDEEYNAIGEELKKGDPNTSYHTSGHRKSKDDPWVWSDKEGDSVTEFHWKEGEPSEAKKDAFCIVTSIKDGTQQWENVPCSATRRFICQSKDEEGNGGS